VSNAHRALGIAMSMALAACTAAAPQAPAAAKATGDPCLDSFKRYEQAFGDELFRADYIYACRLSQAFDDYVKPRRTCRRDDDCVFVAGACGINSAVVNKSYAREINEIRDRVRAAHDKVVSCSNWGGVGTRAPPRCSHSECE